MLPQIIISVKQTYTKTNVIQVGCPAVLAEVKSPKAFTNHIARDFFIVSGN